MFSANARLGHANQCGRSPHPGPGRLGAALAQPQLNQPSITAAVQLTARVEALTLPPGQTRDPLSSRQPQRYLRPLPEPTGKVARYHV
jgi:hypothetical protein